MEKMLISGVAKDEDVARISIIGVPDRPGLAFKIFSKLSAKNQCRHHSSVDRPQRHEGYQLYGRQINLKDALDALTPYIELIGAASIVHDENVAKVSIVGAGMESHPALQQKCLKLSSRQTLTFA